MSFSDYLEAKVLDHVFGDTLFDVPAILYIGLCTSIDEDGAITGEPTIGVNGYARVEIDNDTDTWNDAEINLEEDTEKTNKIQIEFPEAEGAWGSLTKFFITDAATGNSNTWCYGDLIPAKSPTAGDIITLPIGKLKIKLD